VALSEQYQKDLNYLMEKSNKGTLNSDNQILKKMQDRARNLPELQRAMSRLRINYV
jgi:hypothetical protein